MTSVGNLTSLSHAAMCEQWAQATGRKQPYLCETRLIQIEEVPWIENVEFVDLLLVVER